MQLNCLLRIQAACKRRTLKKVQLATRMTTTQVLFCHTKLPQKQQTSTLPQRKGRVLAPSYHTTTQNPSRDYHVMSGGLGGLRVRGSRVREGVLHHDTHMSPQGRPGLQPHWAWKGQQSLGYFHVSRWKGQLFADVRLDLCVIKSVRCVEREMVKRALHSSERGPS